jgi:hypothetical protein
MTLITKKIIPYNAPSVHAFKILVGSSTTNPNLYTAKINPGTVNNIIPTNIIDTSKGTLKEFTFNKDSLMNIILKCNSNGKIINSATVTLQTTPPAAQTPIAFGLPNTVEIFLGAVYNNNIYQAVRDNISLGGYVQYIANNKTQELPYTIYLIWGSNFQTY